MITPRMVMVEWEDASATDDGTWLERENAPVMQPVIFQQVGWLLEQNDQHVVMTCALSDKLMASRDRIPRGMVKRIVGLTSAKPQRKQR